MRDFKHYYETVASNIYDHGQFLQGVFGDGREELPFMYTIGNFQHGLPELLVVGMMQNEIAVILNAIGRAQREAGVPFESGTLVDVGFEVKFKVIDATEEAKNRYTIQVGRFYKVEEYRVQQVLLPDSKGHFPGEEGCELPYRDLPVLAIRPH